MGTIGPYLDKKYRWSSHWWIAKMLAELPEGARVLDVGVASGMIARACAGRGYIMRGVEPVGEWIEEARQLYSDLYWGSLEHTPDDFLSGHVAVVCGDVLEHLVQPVDQLTRLVALQPEGCVFVISVPNIANLWIRLNLLIGRFDYTERGILDATHLHFYTRKIFLDLVRKAGLVVQELRATPIPMDLISSFFSRNPLGIGTFTLIANLTRIWPTLLGYQWVARTIKNTKA